MLVHLKYYIEKWEGGNANQALVSDQLTGQPQERLLEVVVGLGGDIVVLEVLLPVEGDGLGLHLALLDVDLVTAEDDGDVLADTDEVAYLRVSPRSMLCRGERPGAGKGRKYVRCQLGTFL